MSPDITGFRNVGSEVTGTSGTTAAAIVTSDKRSALYLANCGSSAIYVKFAKPGATPNPTVSATDFHEIVNTGESRVFGFSDSVSVWVYSASNVAYRALPVGY